jgi:hypothetical protein
MTLQPAWVRKISALRRMVLLSSMTITFRPAIESVVLIVALAAAA